MGAGVGGQADTLDRKQAERYQVLPNAEERSGSVCAGREYRPKLLIVASRSSVTDKPAHGKVVCKQIPQYFWFNVVCILVGSNMLN